MAASNNISLALLFCFGLLVVQVTSLTLQDATMYEKHEQWMGRFGKVYKDNQEREMRFKIFKENVNYIEASNKDVSKPYKLGINKFVDLTNEEFITSRNGFKRHMPSSITRTSTFRYENVTKLPSSVDWRKKGAVTPVKDQAQCGSCWAFSAVAAIEGAHKLSSGKLVSLSEQELVDCDINGEDAGCSGGLMDDAFKFIIKNNGLNTEAEYPYQGVDGTCKKKGKKHAVTITGYEDVPANNERALIKALAHQPISVAIEASGYDFQFYKTGIFNGSCGTDLDHGVTAVGYGVSGDGTKYWLVKNSWGAEWGEKGYFKMKRGVKASEGLCGIAMQASYPIV